MKTTYRIHYPGGDVVAGEIDWPRKPSLEQIHEVTQPVLGDVPLERLLLDDGHELLFDEVGKLKGLPVNREATTLAHERAGLWPDDFLVGPVIEVDRVVF